MEKRIVMKKDKNTSIPYGSGYKKLEEKRGTCWVGYKQLGMKKMVKDMGTHLNFMMVIYKRLNTKVEKLNLIKSCKVTRKSLRFM